MSQQDHYAVLGLTDKASDEEIRKAYKRLALRWHPDRDKSEAAKSTFISIKAAHRVLSNPALRADYDARRSLAGLRIDESILLSEDENLFASQDSVFRTQAAASKPQAPPNLDIFDTISITLAELYTGVVRWLEVKRRVRCSDCQPASPGCRTCNGRHLVEVKKKLKLEISAFHEPPAEYRFAGDGDESLDPRGPPGRWPPAGPKMSRPNAFTPSTPGRNWSVETGSISTGCGNWPSASRTTPSRQARIWPRRSWFLSRSNQRSPA
jgi:DnaJ-class molecular chaperone